MFISYLHSVSISLYTIKTGASRTLETLKLSLIHTPWWVYVLFARLIFIEIKASRPSQTDIYKMFIMPILFTCVSIHTLLTGIPLQPWTIASWLVSTFIGCYLGWLKIKHSIVTVEPKTKIVHNQGDWGIMVIITIILVSKYYFSYALGTDPTMVNNTIFDLSMPAVSGIASGMFIGRLIRYYDSFKHGPFASTT